ncbi:MAG: arabinan endo-1,5-alpha-L-arabinosidase, partial [Enterococcus aquimarinus]|nr:arabinan endo-1,5-alpha-L-arabinosidase [Enterococcus aquimarinus]
MKKFRIMFLLPVLLLLSSCQETIESKDWDTIEMPRVSVHDPSITSVTEDGEEVFYIFGSHLAQAKSKDLVNWEVPFQTEYEDLDNNIILGDIDKNLREAFEWAGKDDADSAGGYSIWAPDVIWNPNYKWKNGDKGAYMYYYSATSTWRRSNIGFAVSKTIEGPYAYQDTVVYSGFTQVDSTDGSDRNTHYKNTHLKKLISTGVIDEFSSNWVRNSGTEYNTDYAPNAIDPTLFYDENEKLWMVYGSWSGGMYILPIDEETGIPMYPGIDSENQGLIVDRYFGTKLIGGYHQSGEGPYIVYDKETQSYYLFVTYGQLHS